MNKWMDRGAAVFFFVLSVLVWIEIPFQTQASWSSFGIGSRGFPRMMTIVMGVFSLLLFIMTFFRSDDADAEADDAPVDSEGLESLTDEEDYSGPFQNPTNFFVLVILMGAYVLLIGSLGFAITTFVLTAVTMVFLGARPMWKALLVSGVATTLIFYAFESLMHVSLPAGFLG